MSKEQDGTSNLYAPLNDDELISIRAEIRESDRKNLERKADTLLEGLKLFSQQHHSGRTLLLTNSLDYGKAFARAAFLLNAGAIIALFTFLGSLYGKAERIDAKYSASLRLFTIELQNSFMWFGCGLLAAASISAAGFFAWALAAKTYLNEGQTLAMILGKEPLAAGDDHKEVEKNFLHADRWTNLGVIFIVILSLFSLVSFIMGALGAVSALGRLAPV